jgi:hypothetical protein
MARRPVSDRVREGLSDDRVGQTHPAQAIFDLAQNSYSDSVRLNAARLMMQLLAEKKSRDEIEDLLGASEIDYRSLLTTMLGDPSLTSAQRVKVVELLRQEDALANAQKASEAETGETSEMMVPLECAIEHAVDYLWFWVTDPAAEFLRQRGGPAVDTDDGVVEDGNEPDEGTRVTRELVERFEERIERLVAERAEARAVEIVEQRGAQQAREPVAAEPTAPPAVIHPEPAAAAEQHPEPSEDPQPAGRTVVPPPGIAAERQFRSRPRTFRPTWQ